MNDNILYILFECDHWDMPLSGLGRYNGDLVWYTCHDEFDIDENTGERLSHEEVLRRNRMVEKILDEYSDDQLLDSHEAELEKRLEQVGEPISTRIYAVHELSPIDKVRARLRKLMFELFVGTHWSWDRVKPGQARHRFRINRWFGLGRLLFKLYYLRAMRKDRKQQYPDPDRGLKNNKVIAYVRLEDCQFGEPTNE